VDLLWICCAPGRRLSTNKVHARIKIGIRQVREQKNQNMSEINAARVLKALCLRFFDHREGRLVSIHRRQSWGVGVVTPQILKWGGGSWRGVGVVEGVVSGLLRSKGEGREPRTPPQFSNQIDATGDLYNY
jgi:hypothetical protein